MADIDQGGDDALILLPAFNDRNGLSSIDGQRQIAVYRNEIARGSWLRVRLLGLPGNRGAVGAKIRIFADGEKTLLWYEQLVIYNSQAAASCSVRAGGEAEHVSREPWTINAFAAPVHAGRLLA